jgi:predicted MPP superfamily phosphohydrolase
MISRRQFLRSAVVGASAVGVGLAMRDLRPDSYTEDFILEEVPVRIPGLPRAFDGYRIGFLTDVHLSTWVPKEWIERAIEALSTRKVDVLLLGGDYILVQELSLWNDWGIVRNPEFARMPKREAIPKIYSSFAALVARHTFPDGILGVVGNHDHWNMYPLFESIMRSHPTVQILVNKEVSIRRGEQELCIFGVDDYLTGLPSLPPSRELQNGKAKRIILSHNPDYLAELIHHPQHEFSLALCGHTHGGQIVLPLVGPVAAQVVDRRFVAGMQRVLGERLVYTSRGLGVVGLPFRINCPAEVTIFNLAVA